MKKLRLRAILQTEWPPTGLRLERTVHRVGAQTAGVRVGAEDRSRCAPVFARSCSRVRSWLAPRFFSSHGNSRARDGFIDGNGERGSVAGSDQLWCCAGGHETVICAIEKLGLPSDGDLDLVNTILRVQELVVKIVRRQRLGDFRVHLSRRCRCSAVNVISDNFLA